MRLPQDRASRQRISATQPPTFITASKGVEWPAKRCYVGLVAVGVQEQAEDILVLPLLRNGLTLNDIFSLSLYPILNSGPCNSFYCLGHFENVYDDNDDNMSPHSHSINV